MSRLGAKGGSSSGESPTTAQVRSWSSCFCTCELQFQDVTTGYRSLNRQAAPIQLGARFCISRQPLRPLATSESCLRCSLHHSHPTEALQTHNLPGRNSVDASATAIPPLLLTITSSAHSTRTGSAQHDKASGQSAAHNPNTRRSCYPFQVPS